MQIHAVCYLKLSKYALFKAEIQDNWVQFAFLHCLYILLTMKFYHKK